MKLKLSLCVIVLVSLFVWCGCLCFRNDSQFFNQQKYLFYRAGDELYGDFVEMRGCVGQPDCYERHMKNGEELGGIGYPALALWVLRLFPAGIKGGLVYSAVSSIMFMLTLIMLVKSLDLRYKILALAACACNQVFLYAFERSNLVTLTAALVVVHFLWFDDRCRWKRMVAVLAISVATVLKIYPVVFGILYLRQRQWRDIVACVIVSSVLFVLPFVNYGGLGSFVAFVANAGGQCADYAGAAHFGGVLLGRVLMVSIETALGRFAGEQYVQPLVQWVVIALGFAMLSVALLWGLGVKRFEKLSRAHVYALLAFAMIIIPGNAIEYTGLYLFPVFLYWFGLKKCRYDGLVSFGWFLLFFHLQIYFGMMMYIHNLGFLLLALYAVATATVKSRDAT